MYKAALVTILLFLLVGAQFVCAPGTAFGQDKIDKQKKLAMTLAIKPNSNPIQIVCLLKNTSDTDIQLYDFLTNGNGLIITTPDGKQQRICLCRDPGRKTTVKVGEEKSWSFDLNDYFTMLRLNAPGIYRMKWFIDEEESNELTIIQDDSTIINNGNPILTLELALIYERSTIKLQCSVKNNGKTNFAAEEFQSCGNDICYIFPDGKTRNTSLSDDPSPDTVIIKPGEIKVWIVDLSNEIRPSVFPPGHYVIYWAIGKYESNKIPLIIEDNKAGINK